MLSRSSTGREHDKKCLVGSKTTCRTTAVAFECSYEIYALCIRPQDQDSHDGSNGGLEGVPPRDKIDAVRHYSIVEARVEMVKVEGCIAGVG